MIKEFEENLQIELYELRKKVELYSDLEDLADNHKQKILHLVSIINLGKDGYDVEVYRALKTNGFNFCIVDKDNLHIDSIVIPAKDLLKVNTRPKFITYFGRKSQQYHKKWLKLYQPAFEKIAQERTEKRIAMDAEVEKTNFYPKVYMKKGYFEEEDDIYNLNIDND